MATLESSLERRACEYIRRCGGLALKFISPGYPGVPDRICFFPDGRIIFIEFKRPGRTDGLSPQQRRMHLWLKNMGQTAWVVNDFDTMRLRLSGLGYTAHGV